MLSDTEREAYFERKHKEIVEKMLGKESPYPIPDVITTRLTSKIGESWYEKPRILQNMNIDKQSQEYIAWYNAEFRKNNGRIVTYVEEPLDEEVPPPVK